MQYNTIQYNTMSFNINTETVSKISLVLELESVLHMKKFALHIVPIA
jgi:hypothetical protein